MSFRSKVFVLQCAVAFVFAWFGVDKLLHPDAWAYWVPELVTTYIKINPAQFMLFNGAVEVILAAWLLIPYKTHWAAYITALYFLPILLITGLTQAGIRDIGLFLATISLGMLLTPAYIDLHFKE